jgi:hypothetical protein
MDVRRSRLPENPVNIGLSAQKSAKQWDGPSARGTQSTKEGNSHRDKVKACPQAWLHRHNPQTNCVTPSCLIYLKLNSQTQFPFGAPPPPYARRGFSLRSSLLGASGFIQPTAVIMRHAKQSAPERPLKVAIYVYRSGAKFCSKGHRITLLSGAARMPIKGKAAQPYFKLGGANF